MVWLACPPASTEGQAHQSASAAKPHADLPAKMNLLINFDRGNTIVPAVARTHLMALQVRDIILQPQTRAAEVRILVENHSDTSEHTNRRNPIAEAGRDLFDPFAPAYAELLAPKIRLFEEACPIAIKIAGLA